MNKKWIIIILVVLVVIGVVFVVATKRGKEKPPITRVSKKSLGSTGELRWDKNKREYFDPVIEPDRTVRK